MTWPTCSTYPINPPVLDSTIESETSRLVQPVPPVAMFKPRLQNFIIAPIVMSSAKILALRDIVQRKLIHCFGCYISAFPEDDVLTHVFKHFQSM